jgi:hypothetical protein
MAIEARVSIMSHVVFEFGDPVVAPGLGIFGFPKQDAAFAAHGRAHGLNQVGALDPLGHGLNFVVDKKGLQLRLEILLQDLALSFHGALLGLALHVLQRGPEIVDHLVFFLVLEPVVLGCLF